MSVFSYAKKYKKQLILGPAFKLMEAMFELTLPLFMAYLIDSGIREKNMSVIYSATLYMLGLSVLGLACVLICQYYASIASQGFGTELRLAVVKKVTQFSHTEIDEFGPDTFLTRTINDVNQLQLALAMLIRLVIRAPFLSIGSIVMAFTINTSMGFIFLLTVPIFSFILYILMSKTVPKYQQVLSSIDELNTVTNEQLTGVKVIRAFGNESLMEEKSHHVSEKLANRYLDMTKLSALMSPLTLFMTNMIIALILWVGDINVSVGQLQTGDIVALINYMLQLLAALIVVANLVTIFVRAFSAKKRVEELLNTTPQIQTSALNKTLSFESKNTLSFQLVSFHYPDTTQNVLQNIHFDLKKGQQLGIVGPTGSGKTTLVELIQKFYLPSTGHILLDNQNILDLTTGDIRQSIRYVSQKSVIFSGTIKSNLTMGYPDATEEECWTALKWADCLEFVEDLNMPTAENGTNFSGGQRQRLVIARALISRPAILILDDSLSALDYKTDLTIRQTLASLDFIKNIIIISQRISSVKESDHLLVLNQGTLVAQGTHAELMDESPFYQQIVASQSKEEE
ncbi:ABC transporter ATP-binding protein [Vagococcus luciliae]|uniref:ABC transporter ATP-binding protein n=1 Tax=Vagococcus luciliae TaxID=2920380 RepID=A0ABY5NYG1_9ENTE|nr:ABC transporter ATP-binding protein [Vagococcus luciliae]UUV98533.1 putative ABC transporter ATP-binding protein [Vagococcus luciliae]